MLQSMDEILEQDSHSDEYDSAEQNLRCVQIRVQLEKIGVTMLPVLVPVRIAVAIIAVAIIMSSVAAMVICVTINPMTLISRGRTGRDFSGRWRWRRMSRRELACRLASQLLRWSSQKAACADFHDGSAPVVGSEETAECEHEAGNCRTGAAPFHAAARSGYWPGQERLVACRHACGAGSVPLVRDVDPSIYPLRALIARLSCCFAGC